MESPEKAGRFNYLMEPIRDLSKSWDVEISSVLGAYLTELEHLQITFDGGVTTMNFAEAALLVQGSASVYSKKVERLYQLVLEMIPVLAANKKQKDQQSVEGNPEPNDQEVVTPARKTSVADEEDFQLMEDLREGKSIDMREDLDEMTPCGVKNLTRMPLAMIPLEDFEKTDIPLVTRSGEVVGKKDDFKMNTCYIHESGAILLDVANEELFKSLTDITVVTGCPNTPIRPGDTGQQIAQSSPDVGDIPDDMSDYPAPETSQVESQQGDPEAIETAGVPMDVDLPQPGSSEEQFEPNRRADRLARAPTVVSAVISNSSRPTSVASNPYKLLDPHEATPQLEKPLKKGRQFKIPDQLKKVQPNKRKAPDDETENNGPVVAKDLNPIESISSFVEREFFTRRAKFPKNPPQILLAMPEIEDLYYEEYKRRLTAKKTLMRSRGIETPASVADTESQASGVMRNDLVDLVLPGVETIEECDEDVEDGGFDDDDVAEPLVVEAEIVANGSPDGAEMPLTQGYEEFVRQNMEKFTSNAQLFSSAADIGKRVQEWEEKISPILRAEELRKPFDIHVYESELLDCFKSGDNELFFSDMVTGKDREEICRLFLSSLMLANGGNVEIRDSHADGEIHDVNTMKLKFLSAERHHDQLQDYMAPSTQTFRQRVSNDPSTSASQHRSSQH